MCSKRREFLCRMRRPWRMPARRFRIMRPFRPRRKGLITERPWRPCTRWAACRAWTLREILTEPPPWTVPLPVRCSPAFWGRSTVRRRHRRCRISRKPRRRPAPWPMVQPSPMTISAARSMACGMIIPRGCPGLTIIFTNRLSAWPAMAAPGSPCSAATRLSASCPWFPAILILIPSGWAICCASITTPIR